MIKKNLEIFNEVIKFNRTYSINDFGVSIMRSFSGKVVIVLFVIICFSFFTYSQNFDYQLQNTLERMYHHSSENSRKDFDVFRQTFIAEDYSSFDYLHEILKNKGIYEEQNPYFFHKVDRTQFEIYRKNLNIMVSNKRYAEAFAFSFDTLINYLSNVNNFFDFVVNCISHNYLVIFYFLLIYGVILLLRFLRCLSYDLKKFLQRKRINRELAYYLAMSVVILLPVFFTIHIKYLPIYWVILFFLYLGRKEKLIIYFGISLLFVLSITGGYLVSFSKNYYKNRFFCYESLTTPFSGLSKSKKAKDDYEIFSQAVSLLRRGEAAESIKLFKLIKPGSIFYGYSLNNIGVAYIILSRPKLALNFLNEAVKNGVKYEANINRFYINSKLYNIVESEEALKSAYRSDSFKTSRWLLFNIGKPLPQIAVPDFRDLMMFFYQSTSFSLTKQAFKTIIFLFFLTLLLGIIDFLSRDMSITRCCKKCGTPFKVFESQNEKLCTQCALMTKGKSEMSGEMIELKRKEIRFYSEIKKSFEVAFGLIFPGFYHIFVSKRVFSGFFIFVIFFIVLIDALRAFKIAGNFIIVAPIFGIMILLYLFNLIEIFIGKGED